MPSLIDLTGMRINNLFVVKRCGVSNGGALWLCRCDCGKEIKIAGQTVRKQIACRDCFKKRQVSHGLSKMPEYHIWILMMDRCYNDNSIGYANYGGRGIIICERWHIVENFISDMGKRPSPKHSIERLNVNGNYEPINCVWATTREQSRNRTNNRYLELNGRTMPMISWSEELSIPYATLQYRLRAKWSIFDILTTPVLPPKLKRNRKKVYAN